MGVEPEGIEQALRGKRTLPRPGQEPEPAVAGSRGQARGRGAEGRGEGPRKGEGQGKGPAEGEGEGPAEAEGKGPPEGEGEGKGEGTGPEDDPQAVTRAAEQRRGPGGQLFTPDEERRFQARGGRFNAASKEEGDRV